MPLYLVAPRNGRILLTIFSARYYGQEYVSYGLHITHSHQHSLSCISHGSSAVDLLTQPTPYSPRKINSIVNPYGFEYKGGKIVSQSDSQVHDGAAAPNGNTSTAEDGKDDKTKKAAKAPKPNARARQGPSKKRKLAASFPDEDGDELVKEEDGQEA